MGHKRTIRPNAKRLSALFMTRDKMDWGTFAKKVKSCQRGFMGEPDEMKPGRGEFHEYPSSCICLKPFKRPDLVKDEDGDQPLEGSNITSEAKPRYQTIADKQAMSRVVKKTRIEGPASIADETDHEDFLSD